MAKTIKVSSVLIAAFFIAAGTELAGSKAYEMPKVEYSADSYMETAEATMKAKVYHAADKERREQEMEGVKMTMIIRFDKKIIWTLMPDGMMYMETKMTEEDREADDLSEYDIEETTVGEEVVNGFKTTKRKIIMTHKKTGEKLGGFWWTSKEGILVKMDVIAVDKNTKTRIKSELKNLQIGTQDPKLFEIPSGYSKMSIPMGGGFDIKDMMKRR